MQSRKCYNWFSVWIYYVIRLNRGKYCDTHGAFPEGEDSATKGTRLCVLPPYLHPCVCRMKYWNGRRCLPTCSSGHRQRDRMCIAPSGENNTSTGIDGEKSHACFPSRELLVGWSHPHRKPSREEQINKRWGRVGCIALEPRDSFLCLPSRSTLISFRFKSELSKSNRFKPVCIRLSEISSRWKYYAQKMSLERILRSEEIF